MAAWLFEILKPCNYWHKVITNEALSENRHSLSRPLESKKTSMYGWGHDNCYGKYCSFSLVWRSLSLSFLTLLLYNELSPHITEAHLTITTFVRFHHFLFTLLLTLCLFKDLKRSIVRETLQSLMTQHFPVRGMICGL